MYVDAELVLRAYKPFKLEKGMLFVRRMEECLEIYELDHNIIDRDPYMMNNGHPVELFLFDTSLKTVLADHCEIAWVDEGEDSEDMHEITIDDINTILRNKHRCQIQIKDKLFNEEKMIVPVFDEEKVIIKLIEEDTE